MLRGTVRGCSDGDSLDAFRRLARRPFALLAALLALAATEGCGSNDGTRVPAAESIALTATGPSPLSIGQTVTVYVHASDANGTRIPRYTGATFLTSNPSVASVEKSDSTAVVTALAAGETVISATVRSELVAQLLVRVGAMPVINVTPSAVVFTGYRSGGTIAAQSVAIANAGAGVLSSLSATASATWLQVSFVDGVTVANPTATLRLQPSIGALADGSYSANVTVTSAVAGVMPRTIPVTLQVAAAPVAFKIEAASPPFQSGSAGKPVSQPPAVMVRAADDTPVPGVSVAFAVSGGGAISPTAVVVTNAGGVAALASWTLGSQPGASQTVTASSPGLAGGPLTFTANALSASKIAKVSGDNQSAVIGRPLPEPVIVRVTDPNDAPVPNATVTFAPAGGGTVAPVTATTDASGLASGAWTLGTGLGPQTLGASLVGPQGSPTVTFTATATGATNIVQLGGDGQEAAAGSALPLPVRVRVTGAGEQPVMGVTVTFQPGADAGSASPPTATTDANGEASTRWTMPTSIGPKVLTASIDPPSGPVSVTFGATATAPPPGGILITDGDNQSGRGGSPLARQVVARVVTTIGTPVPGASVTFTPATGAGASFSPAGGVADSNGEVRTTWTLGNALGVYTATVSSPGVPSRTITATANLLPPNVGMFAGGAAKVPGGAAPAAGDQAVLAYTGPASGEVPLTADGGFSTPTLPPGSYTLAVVSKSGAFPPTSVYGATIVGGQVTSVGTISIAYPGSGTVRIALHACAQVGDANGSAVVRLYAGVNGDQSGAPPAHSWTLPFGNVNSQADVGYGIYTMTIVTQATDPSKTCADYRGTVVHSHLTAGGTTILPLIVLNNP
jgi:hypothetical protein